MKKGTIPLIPLTVLLAASVAGGVVLAQTSASYNLKWHVIGSGAAPESSANYRVNSTTGQRAASPPYSAGTDYVVSAGYWYTAMHFSYLPLCCDHACRMLRCNALWKCVAPHIAAT